ncbi:protein jagged-1-like [Haliotis rubra]|uniref:protein jagged-1-like n=1 Tax=Haliotis rubra TaxID=36100 RepID=UPI001EE570B9|nr:protein jagged-1-like [Haliotis rubra]
MKTTGGRQGVTLLLWLLITRRAKTDGKLDIRFIRYWSDGKEVSGDCCDNHLRVWCNDKCDPKFTICIDGPEGRKPCSVYKNATNYIHNQDIIHFGSSIQGTPNPFIIHVPKAVPSSIEITVEVYDSDDTSSDDHMDTLSKLINIQAAATEQAAVYTPYTVWGRTKLKIEVRAYCDPDWYGSACATYCKATPDHSHYTCHPHTGAKMCFEGWKGDNCDEDIDECAEINNLCQRGGSCTNTLGSFMCSCTEGVTGRQCENIINQCALAPCLNGGTCDGNETAFNCTCSVEWTGGTCAEKVNFCDSAPCNRGNCTPDFLTATGFKCNCEFAWVGERCSHAVDIFNITLLGEIGHTNRGDLADGLDRLITELGGIPGKVDVKFTTNAQKESNYTTTYIQLYFAVENGSFLESDSLDRIFESNPDEVISEYLPLPLYPRQQEEKEKITVFQTMATERSRNSWDKGQYVKTIGTPLGFALMTVILWVALWIWRRRSHNSDQFLEDDQISLFVMDVACNRSLNRPGNVTGTRQDASVSPSGYTSLHFHDHERSLDTDCDDTLHIHIATEDMMFDPVFLDDNNLHDDEAKLDTGLHVASYIHPVPADITLDPASLEDEEDEAEYTVIDDNDVEDPLQENPYETIESFDENDVDNISQTNPYEKINF